MNDRKFLDYVTSIIENQKPSGATYVITQLAISLCRKDILPYSSLFNYIEDRSSFFSKAAASIRMRSMRQTISSTISLKPIRPLLASSTSSDRALTTKA